MLSILFVNDFQRPLFWTFLFGRVVFWKFASQSRISYSTLSCLTWFNYAKIIVTDIFSTKIIVYRSSLIQIQATAKLWHWNLLLFLSNAFSSCFAWKWLIHVWFFVHVYVVLSFAEFQFLDSEFLNVLGAKDAFSFFLWRRDQLKGRLHLTHRYSAIAVYQWRLWNKTWVLNRSTNWSYLPCNSAIVWSDGNLIRLSSRSIFERKLVQRIDAHVLFHYVMWVFLNVVVINRQASFWRLAQPGRVIGDPIVTFELI